MVATVVPTRIPPTFRTAPPAAPAPSRRADPARPGRSGRATTARQPAEVYRRRRIVAVGLLAAVVVAGWVGLRDLVAGPGAAGLGPTQPIAAHIVVVQPGDTLWSIALASGATGDIRPLVDRLSAEVHGRPLVVGERVLVP